MIRRIYHKLKRIIGLEKPSHRAKLWNKITDEKKRYEYDINEQSVVFDLGGYEGQWASDIFAMYAPTIYIFEPVESFAQAIKQRFKKNKKIKVYQYGLSKSRERISLSLSANGSSAYIETTQKESIELLRAVDFFKENNITKIDLMKINIEGGEYDLLEHLIETGFIKNIKNIQVQFHNFVPNAEARIEAIQAALRKTHHTTYAARFIWENWLLT